jgi:hypothetical protein
MRNLLWALLFFFILPDGVHAQFEKAFETPQPQRIRWLERTRSALYDDSSLTVQLEAYTRLLGLAERHHDPQTVLYAKACQAVTELRLDSTRLKDFTDQMGGLIQQSLATDNEILQVQLLMNLVDYLALYHRLGVALSYYILADDIINRLQPDDGPRDLHGLKHDLIINLYRIGDYQRAKDILDRWASVEKPLKYEFLFDDLHSQILLQLHQYDSSAYYIFKAKEILDQDTVGNFDKGWTGILKGNLAKINYFRKEYTQAVPSLREAVYITREAKLYDNTAPFGLLLANCYIELQETDSIKTLMPIIREAVYQQIREEHYINYYKLMLAMPDDQLTMQRKFQLMDSIDIRQQRLAELNDWNLLTKNEMESELQEFEEKQNSLNAEIRKQLRWRNLLWTLLGGGVLISFYVFTKRNRRFRMEQNRLEQMQVQTEQELAAAREQLGLFTTTLLDKSRQIELLENNIDISQQHEALEHLRQNTILTEEDWVRFKVLFERAYPSFFARVILKFSNLTPGELRFIAFVKLDFTTREMASTLGVSPVSVRSIRSRLLKKLNLPESENLGQIISSL